MAFTTITTTQNKFLENHLRGTTRTLTSAQAEALYNIRNLRARISEMRSNGLRVRKTTNTRGRTAYAISRRDEFGSQFQLYR